MYYIIFPLLYLLSLLPFPILYGISSFAGFLLHKVFKYRKDVVLGNLAIAFPEKTEAERQAIAKQFYYYFTDNFIESLKFISISKKQLLRRSTGDFTVANQLIAEGKNIHLMVGHQFNWEYANLLFALNLNIPFVAIYMPVKNKALDKVFYDIRKRYGTVLISAPDFRKKMHTVFHQQYILALAADQNPGDPTNAYWMHFFGKPVPFVTGPEKGARKNNTAVVYIAFKRVKRGYYHFETSLLHPNGADTEKGELTQRYRDKLAETIRQDPANYLWSHRRFKFTWKPEYGPLMD